MFKDYELQQMREEIIEYLDDGSWDTSSMTDLDVVYIYYSLLAEEQEWKEIIYDDYYMNYYLNL